MNKDNNFTVKDELITKTLNDTRTKLKASPGIENLILHGASVFMVGGIVRDAFLGVESKDIDLIVRFFTQEQIIDELRPFGKVDTVGDSFGVIKFTPTGWTDEPIDIALPRTETKLDGVSGHHAFDVTTDPFLPIDKDLERRDLTINAIALNVDTGEFVDPFDGIDDIKNQVLNFVSAKTFVEDPLRMMRAFQFASRLGFKLSRDLIDLIDMNKDSILEISGERIFIELHKMFHKRESFNSLHQTIHIMNEIGFNDVLFGDKVSFVIGTFEDFIFEISHGNHEFTRDNLKADAKLVKCIRTLENLNFNGTHWLVDFVDAVDKFPELHNSMWFNIMLGSLGDEFNARPITSRKDLQINGNDLLSMGQKGEEIGETLNKLFIKVIHNKIANNRAVLLNNV